MAFISYPVDRSADAPAERSGTVVEVLRSPGMQVIALGAASWIPVIAVWRLVI